MKKSALLWFYAALLMACAPATSTGVPPSPDWPSTKPVRSATSIIEAAGLPTAFATPTVRPLFTATARPSPVPPPTPRPTEPVGVPLCPDNPMAAVAGFRGEMPDLIQKIQAYLESGQPIDELGAKFTQESEEPLKNYVVNAVGVDFEGDGTNEVVVGITNGNWAASGSGAFIFRRCPPKGYSVYYANPSPDYDGLYESERVRLMPVQLLADSGSQLIARYDLSLSGRCIESTLLGVRVDEQEWKPFLADTVGCDSRFMSIISDTVVLDPGDDGRRGLQIVGDRQTGWGITIFAHRESRVRYSWQGDWLAFSGVEFGVGQNRFQILEDADAALDRGDGPGAIELYRQAATDTGLRDVVSWYEYDTLGVGGADDAEYAHAQSIARAYQSAFAGFRMVVLMSAEGETDPAQIELGKIRSQYTEGQPGNEFIALAEIYLSAVIGGVEPDGACQKVNEAVASDYPNLTGIDGHVGNWGDYGEYTVDTICRLP